MIQQRSRWVLGALVLVSSLLLFACGGSGGSSGDNSRTVSTGSVGILVTDAPSDDFKAIEVTVNGISLIAEDSDPIEIWSSADGEIIDLLSLETEAMLFTMVKDVQVGWYNKIRLNISKVELVNFDDTRIEVDVPSGKIDLNPRGTFYVNADELLLLQLDFDAKKSIHLVNANHYRLRPVVFVDILTTADMGRLVHLPGTIISIDTDNSQFVLLHEAIQYLIRSDSETVFFGPYGEPIAFGDLAVDDSVIAVGHFQLDSDDSHPKFDAVLVEQGDYQNVRGSLVAVDEGILKLIDAENQEWWIYLDDKTAFYDCLGEPIDRSELVTGQRVAVDVVENNQNYYAALVVACPEAVDSLSGELESIDTTTLTVEGQCAEEASRASYYLLGEDSLTEITRDDLQVDDIVLLFGVEDADPAVCFAYRQLFIIADE